MQGKRLPIARESEGLSAMERRKQSRKRLPSWFKTYLPTGEAQTAFNDVRGNVLEHQLNTVCQEARCPNIHDCWGRGTATFMVAGEECTRACRFCAVGTVKTPPKLDVDEPENLAEAVDLMGVTHAVITCVNRDELPDGGASHYRACLEAVHRRRPDVGLEFLSSDLDGNISALESLLKGFPPSSIENPASQIDIRILEEIEAEDILSIEGIVTGKSIEGSTSIVDCSVVIERQDKTVVANASARLALGA